MVAATAGVVRGLIQPGSTVQQGQKIGDIDVAIEEGMKEKAEEFRKQGAEIYKEV